MTKKFNSEDKDVINFLIKCKCLLRNRECFVKYIGGCYIIECFFFDCLKAHEGQKKPSGAACGEPLGRQALESNTDRRT